LAAGVETPVPLEELESHLREDVEKQMQRGVGAQLAFEAAVLRIGQASEIKNEFDKTYRAQWSGKFWWIWLWIGSFGLVVTVIMNLVGRCVIHRRSSVFFSHQWWADWLPSYIVWISLTIIGSAIGFTRRLVQRKTAGQCQPRGAHLMSGWTWSPFQSSQVKEICAHLTPEEFDACARRAMLYGVWVSLTFAGPLSLLSITFFSRARAHLIPLGTGGLIIWAICISLVLLHCASIPFWLRGQRRFLCSTQWARTHDLRPERIKLFFA
jgi:hypothetical protein